MAYAVGLYFDQPAEETLRKIWATIEQIEVASLSRRTGGRPCIVLATALQLDTTNMRMELKRFASQLKPITVAFEEAKMVSGDRSMAVLPIALNQELDTLHKGLHNFFRKVCQSPRAEYFPGRWAPCVVLADDLTAGQAAEAARAAATIPIGPAALNELAVCQANPVRVNVVFSMNLDGGAFRDRS